MLGLTEKQIALLDFIRLYAERHGVSPTIREMTERFDYDHTNVIRERLDSLEAKGHITKIKGLPRSIELAAPRAIRLNPEIHRLATAYAAEHGIALETATNELLRGALGAA